MANKTKNSLPAPVAKDEIRVMLGQCCPRGIIRRTLIQRGAGVQAIDKWIDECSAELVLQKDEDVLAQVRGAMYHTLSVVDDGIARARSMGKIAVETRLLQTRAKIVADMLRWAQAAKVGDLVDQSDLAPADAAAILAKAWGSGE